LFEIGVLALRESVTRGIIDDEWDLVGIGAAEPYTVPISAGRKMEILPRVAEREYEGLIRGFDIGLSLMSTPHPGVVHFEWAASGMITVVNTPPERDCAYFARYGTNIIASEPTIPGVVDGIGRAIALLESRQAEPSIDLSAFPESWDEVFSPEFLREVLTRTGFPLDPKSEMRLDVRTG
jgi:hypothetical protein